MSDKPIHGTMIATRSHGIISLIEMNEKLDSIQLLNQQLEKLKFQLDVAEEVLSVQVTKSALAYFEDKRKSLENNVTEN